MEGTRELSDIKVEQVGYVFVISINRPEKKNAFTLHVLEEIVELLKALRKDKTCRVVVLTGQGDAFCSGVDLSVVTQMKAENASAPHDWKELLMDHVHEIALTLDDFDKPVIATIGAGGSVKIVGFITRESLDNLGLEDHVAVYMPQSYNFAGNVLLLPKDAVTPLDIDSSQAMAFVVSGGVSCGS